MWLSMTRGSCLLLTPGTPYSKDISKSFSAFYFPPGEWEGWKTTILLVNEDTHTVLFTMNCWANNGSPLVLPVLQDGTTASVSGTIAPG